MKKPIVFFVLFSAVFLALFSASRPASAGYSTTNVPVNDPVYRDIDKLIAAGLVRDDIYGQRPWSRVEIARLISDAMKNSAGVEVPPYINEILRELEREYQDELSGSNATKARLDEVRFDYTLLDSPDRTVPVNNGLGSINAFVNPFASYQEGRHFVDGSTLAIEPTVSADLTKFFSFYARPRFELLIPKSGGDQVNPIVQQLYGKFAYKNFELEVGRDSLVWGQGEYGGLILSNNARPLDMIKISSSAPFYLPSILKYLGPSKATFFIANLGPQQSFRYPFLYGLNLSIKPTTWLELGLDHTIITGGEGAPSLNWYDPVEEFFFVRPNGAHSNIETADQRFGINWRLKIPPLRNTEWYFETLWDDFGRQTVIANITQQMAFVSGIYIPRLLDDGSADLRLEYTRIPAPLYRNSTWVTGYSLDQRLIGSETGPDGNTIRVVSNYDLNPRLMLTGEAAYEERSADIYASTLSSQGQPDQYVKILDNPNEYRMRVTGQLRWNVEKNLRVELKSGYERVYGFNFVSGSDINNFLGSIAVVFLP
jgi:hypothetical protein